MHPINKLLSLVGLSLSRLNTNSMTIDDMDDNERAFKQRYENYYKLVEGNKRGFKAIRAYRYQAGNHPIQDTGS